MGRIIYKGVECAFKEYPYGVTLIPMDVKDDIGNGAGCQKTISYEEFENL